MKLNNSYQFGGSVFPLQEPAETRILVPTHAKLAGIAIVESQAEIRTGITEFGGAAFPAGLW